MANLVAGFRYLFNNSGSVLVLFGEHLRMAAIALAIALAIAMPLGLLLARMAWLRGPVLGVLGVIYTIPSLSLFVLLIPVLGWVCERRSWRWWPTRRLCWCATY